MVRLIEEKRQQGTYLTVLGFGTGNLQDSKMEKLADHGNGNFAYIDNVTEARKVLVEEIGGTLLTIAKDVKIQVEFNPTKVAAYRLIGYENRLLRDEEFNDDTKDAGELGAGHSVTALYEVIPVGIDSSVRMPGVDSLRYQSGRDQRARSDSNELLYVKLRYKEPDGTTSKLLALPVGDTNGQASRDQRFVSAVAGFGMLLRGSEYCDGLTLTDVVELAQSALGEDRGGYRTEFVRLVEAVRSMELLRETVAE
jgi:Ca-activated chloride channel family protein